ncbi:MAG: response regulator transcription factor [Dongiaceae bacterium]
MATGITTIIIEEALELRTALTNILSGRGHTVHGFSTGDQFTEAMAAHTAPVSTTLAIVDTASPDVVGLEAIRLIRRRYPAAKILAMVETGRFGTSDSQRILAQSAGAEGVLVKPFTAQELASSIRELLGSY